MAARLTRVGALLVVLGVLPAGCTAARTALRCVAPPALDAAARDLLAGPAPTWEAELGRWLGVVGDAGRCALETIAALPQDPQGLGHSAAALRDGTACEVDAGRHNGCLESRARAYLTTRR